MLVQVRSDAGTGHAAHVHANVEALGAGDVTQHAHRDLGEVREFGRLALVQVGVVGHVPDGADHQVPAVVRIQVEDRVDQRAPGDDQRLLVGHLLNQAKRAAFAGTGPWEFVLPFDVGHPVRHPEPPEAVRGARAILLHRLGWSALPHEMQHRSPGRLRITPGCAAPRLRRSPRWPPRPGPRCAAHRCGSGTTRRRPRCRHHRPATCTEPSAAARS